MKQLANGVQYLLVLIIVYPVYYIWETDKVINFCEQVETGMSKEHFVQLGQQASVRMIGPQDESLAGGKWQAMISPGMFISADECVVRGAGPTVATARLFEK